MQLLNLNGTEKVPVIRTKSRLQSHYRDTIKPEF